MIMEHYLKRLLLLYAALEGSGEGLESTAEKVQACFMEEIKIYRSEPVGKLL